MNKLSFRARALDASKPLPIYLSEELPDLPEYSAINRAVPQMPSGMEKEEECEHHLQRAIVTGLIIPTPEVTKIDDMATYDRLYPPNYKPSRQLIRMQPFAMEEDYPDYDIDSEDEKWITMQKLDISPRKFEEMMDKLEKNCAQNFAAQDRKDLLLRDDDELSIAIYDYWLSKRLRTPQALVPTVKTELNNRGPGQGVNNNNNPYLAFRRRTEKMQTRKNRKNDEASYEKMIKLKRDLTRALTLLELVKRREASKRQLLESTIDIYEKRFQVGDMNGALLAEANALKPARPAFVPLYSNQFTPNHQNWTLNSKKDEIGLGRKEKRPYKRRKIKVVVNSNNLSSGEEEVVPSPPSPTQQAAYPFLRNKNCLYQAPLSGGKIGNSNWCSPEEDGLGENKYRFSLTSLSTPTKRCVGLSRRRLGRGGRVILDRAGTSTDDFWTSLDFTIHDSSRTPAVPPPNFRPKSPVQSPPRPSSVVDETDFTESSLLNLQVESIPDCEITQVDLDLSELFPDLGVLRQDFGCGRRFTSSPVTQSTSTSIPNSPVRQGSSLLEKWAESSSATSSRQTSFDISDKQTFNNESISASEFNQVGSSQFFVTDGKARTHCTLSTPLPVSSSLLPPSLYIPPNLTPSSSLSSIPTSSVFTSSASVNGPIAKLNEHGTSWFVTTSGQTVVCKQHGSNNSISSSGPILKLPGRPSSTQLTGEEMDSDKRSSVSLLQHTQPMEVT